MEEPSSPPSPSPSSSFSVLMTSLSPTFRRFLLPFEMLEELAMSHLSRSLSSDLSSNSSWVKNVALSSAVSSSSMIPCGPVVVAMVTGHFLLPFCQSSYHALIWLYWLYWIPVVIPGPFGTAARHEDGRKSQQTVSPPKKFEQSYNGMIQKYERFSVIRSWERRERIHTYFGARRPQIAEDPRVLLETLLTIGPSAFSPARIFGNFGSRGRIFPRFSASPASFAHKFGVLVPRKTEMQPKVPFRSAPLVVLCPCSISFGLPSGTSGRSGLRYIRKMMIHPNRRSTRISKIIRRRMRSIGGPSEVFLIHCNVFVR